MQEERKKIFIYPSSYEFVNKETQYGVILAKTLNRPAVIIDIENIPPNITPTAIVGTGIPPVATIDMERLKINAGKKLEKLEKFVKIIWEEVNHEVEIGFPEASLIEKIKDEAPYLLVIGKYSHLNLMNEWFGTFETRIAQEAACPVLIVPEDCEWENPQQIFYVTEQLTEEVDNLIWLVQFAKVFNTQITVAETSKELENGEEGFTKVKTRIRHDWNYDQLDYLQISISNPEAIVNDIISDRDADWLAFENRDRNFFQRLLGRNASEHRILGSDIPVLVF